MKMIDFYENQTALKGQKSQDFLKGEKQIF